MAPRYDEGDLHSLQSIAQAPLSYTSVDEVTDYKRDRRKPTNGFSSTRGNRLVERKLREMKRLLILKQLLLALSIAACTPTAITPPPSSATPVPFVTATLIPTSFPTPMSASPAPPVVAGDIVFQRYIDAHTTGDGRLWSINADGSGLVQLTRDLPGCTDPAFSPDGTSIAFAAIGPRVDFGGLFDRDIFVINADGSGLTDVVPEEGGQYSPTWSPNGSQIAFESPRGHSGTDIWLVNADGSGLVQLTSDVFMDQYPVFSPDGSSIAFVSNRSRSYEIWLMNADGSDQTQLTADDEEPEEIRYPAFSPDGLWIVFQARRSDSPSAETRRSFEIWVMNVDGSHLTQLTLDDEMSDEHPDFSPDGRRIVFSCNRFGGSFDLCMINADGSDLTQLTTGPEDDMSPDWRTSPIP